MAIHIRSRCSLLAASAFVLMINCVLLAHAAPAVRVRKEIRRLTPTEVKLFAQGISTMMSVDTKAGAALYGPAYKEYEYFVVKHATAYSDPRGDQGHNDACFMTFHRALLLEFERSLLSVVPALKALPYWNLVHDVRGGKYKNGTENHIFSPKWAGKRDGDKNYNYTVTDGLFSWHSVPRFNWQKWGDKVGWVYNGSTTTGLTRSAANKNTNPYLTRYPTAWYEKAFLAMPGGQWFLYPNYTDTELPLNYTGREYNRCTNPKFVQRWTNWQLCVDQSSMIYAGFNMSQIEAIMAQSTAPLLHGHIHLLLGSHSLEGVEGDMTDVATSPNENFVFMPHHANVDRNNMLWQINVAKVNKKMATKDVMWEYPASNATWPTGKAGCFLHDVISSNFPFTDIFPGVKPSKPGGFTHFDVLWNTRPGVNAPYTYDAMQPEVEPSAA